MPGESVLLIEDSPAEREIAESILTDAGYQVVTAANAAAALTYPDMQDIINIKIKFREQFRPFCPSVLEEDSADYFEGKSKTAPFMVITYDVKEGMDKKIPSVTHVDGTSRIQTVNEDQNALFYHYLRNLKKLTGHGVTLNTSFNVKGDCIVNTPYHALATFYGSGMDTLIMGNFVIEKR